MTDMWDEGYGFALSGRSWLETVGGRFLKSWERRALCHGWKAGLRDRRMYEQDMCALAPLAVEEMPW